MAKGILSRAAAAIRHDLGNEFAYALDDVRHKLVEQPMLGRSATSSAFEQNPEAASFYRWLGTEEKTPEAAAGDGRDPMGRVTAEAEQEDPMRAAAEPMEGRPSNHEERQAEATAYARHQQAGPFGTMEMEDAHSYEWREFEAWLDGKGDGWGNDEIDQRSRELEQEIEGAEHEIE